MSAMRKTVEHPAFVLDKARPEDFAAVKEIFLHVVAEGETYSYESAELTDAWIRHYWLENVITTLVARLPDGKVAGVCAIRLNRSGRGNHIANASYIVALASVMRWGRNRCARLRRRATKLCSSIMS